MMALALHHLIRAFDLPTLRASYADALAGTHLRFELAGLPAFFLFFKREMQHTPCWYERTSAPPRQLQLPRTRLSSRRQNAQVPGLLGRNLRVDDARPAPLDPCIRLAHSPRTRCRLRSPAVIARPFQRTSREPSLKLKKKQVFFLISDKFVTDFCTVKYLIDSSLY